MATEIRAIAQEIEDTELRTSMLGIADDYERMGDGAQIVQLSRYRLDEESPAGDGEPA